MYLLFSCILNTNNMLYLISSKNYLKIGYSDDVQSRILCYKTHNPNCKLLATRQGSRISENYFHILLSKYKINKTEPNDKKLKILNELILKQSLMSSNDNENALNRLSKIDTIEPTNNND